MAKKLNLLKIVFWDLAILMMTESSFVQSMVRAGNSIKNWDFSASKSRLDYLFFLVTIAVMGLLVGLRMGLVRPHP